MMNLSDERVRAYVLLVLAALFFGGNTVAGRLAVGHISPEQIVLFRWVAVVLMLSLILRGRAVSALRKGGVRWRWFFIMGATGYTCFNTLFYFAAHKTSAVNLGILQGTIPVWILMGVFVAHRVRARGLQMFGVFLTVTGVVLLAARGDFEALLATGVNPGDLMMLAACFCYACYTVGLKNRPPVDGLEFFFLLSSAALVSSAPLAVYEVVSGDAHLPDLQGWLVVLYVALFPSFLSQVFFIRGVELIGPGRAGVFLNLVPVFSAVCAVLIIDEPLLWFQAAALVLVIGGIGLSEKSGRQSS